MFENFLWMLIALGNFWWLLALIGVYAFFKRPGASKRIDLLTETVAKLKARVQALESVVSSLRTRDASAPQSEPAPAFEAKPESAPEPEPEPAPEPPWYMRPIGPEFVYQPQPELEPQSGAEPESESESKSESEPEPEPEPAVAAAGPAPTPAPAPGPAPAAPAVVPRRSDQWREPARTALAPEAPEWHAKIKSLLFSGNLVAKLGLLILFIGISFLLKYVATEITVPIELRLAGIVLADIALLVWGWRIRASRPSISLPVQGAALAILMLVTFAAFRLYQLIPSGVALALLLVLTGFTCALAVLQDALWLAVFGIVGGFAAPLLTSTGGGSHVALFSYYALLNGGIFAIATRRSWRPLNLLGFAFTLGIGVLWGQREYGPQHYLSAQLFLILFFLFYVAIALAHAARQELQRRDYVDVALVFGAPLAALGLQYGMVGKVAFGMAFSVLALGLFYGALALVLWQRYQERFRQLAETFVAFGVAFGTLAVPLALSGRWTSAAWAVEGAAMVWLGLRQNKRATWRFGLLLEAAAWLAFVASVSALDPQGALQARLWIGFLVLAASALLLALVLRARPAAPPEDELPMLSVGFLCVAALWLLAGAWTEIALRTDGALELNLQTVSALALAALFVALGRGLRWRAPGRLALALQLAAGLALFHYFLPSQWVPLSPDLFDGPFPSALMLCASLFYTTGFFRRAAGAQHSRKLARLANTLLPLALLCWFLPVLGTLAGWIALRYALHFTIPGQYVELWQSSYLIVVAAGAPLFAALARRLRWLRLRWAAAAAWVALAASSAMTLATLYLADAMPGRLGWIAFGAAWLAGESQLLLWPRLHWRIEASLCRFVHAIRSGAPWLMIWPVGVHHITAWLLAGDSEQQRLLTLAGWETSGSWARYLPAWAMMLALAALIRRARAGGWPLAPLEQWYRHYLIPLGAAWSLALVALWNVAHDGAMAPLPYLPLLNPLDLSTGFALLLGVAAFGPLRPRLAPRWQARLPVILACALYAWFNLMLLRSVSNYMGLPYRAHALVGSQFVQAMLSLVWSVTALALMRHSLKRGARRQWIAGATLLGLVVAKLFLLDLSGTAGLARIVTFLGVGVLMVAIGYLAPFPTRAPTQPEPAPNS